MTPDATRIAVLSPAASAEPIREERTIVFFQNFAAELTRRVATGR